MVLLQDFIQFLRTGDYWKIVTLIFCINLFQVVFVAVVGEWLVKIFAHRRISDHPENLSFNELCLVIVTLLLNSGVTVLGCILWRNGIITIASGSWASMLVDMVVFILFIDLCMYLLHRLAHFERLFPWLHSTHHLYEDPRPITLFVLNPIETLSFGFLWLFILVIYSSSWPGVFLFMTFNLLFGMMGHLGVEPLGDTFFRKMYTKVFATSTFHAMHHKFDTYNYGFYLVLWDKLLNTLHPDYFSRFLKNTDSGKN